MAIQDDVLIVDDDTQIAALTSPARLEVVDAVRVIGPCSIADIGQFLGRAPDSLYYHVRKLLKVGLLIECGTRKTRRRDEAVYRTPARRIRTPLDPHDPARSAQVARVFAALLRLTDRDFKAAAKRGGITSLGPKRNARHGRVKAWLSEGDLTEVHGYLDRILDVFERERPKADAAARKLYSITAFLTPMEPKRRRGGETTNHDDA
ncbi:MAG: helix-turn-helix transcriptional regulator [Phycisphaerales bacterium]|nr:helix-turn-helix transcriptional regulator [Phycisphaerales bacterium]